MFRQILLIAALTVAETSTGVSATLSTCDDTQCKELRARYAATEFGTAARFADKAEIRDCYAAWARYDVAVAEALRKNTATPSRSPRYADVCKNALSSFPNADGSGTINVRTTVNPADNWSGNQIRSITAANSGDLVGAIAGLFNMFGNGTADGRQAFDQNQFDSISTSAQQIAAKLRPTLAYSRLMALQTGIGLPPDTPNSLTVATATVSGSADSLSQRAQSGDGPSQFALGIQYLHGDGVKRDPVLAYKWLRLAAGRSVPGADALARSTYGKLSSGERVQANALISSAAATAGGSSNAPANNSATASHTYPYRGPHADIAEFLLSHVEGWTLLPPKAPALPHFDGQRDAYVLTAASEAWAANAEVAAGRPERAKPIIDSMIENLQKAKALCSSAPVPVGGRGVVTSWMTCSYLMEHV